ncbi:NADPH-dependent pterin aldehyde reductase-like [Momordica charantia]|uniref:NADPH-dependent pterin aldehyde reductase-like n=1 Tax=Momordica charantia TaxID=3673 RepID=A0A6J1DQ73_MOMCH|nr:NADPH-dependent pterin aldehyde reductase-like [Momordica charantia]
MAKTHSNDQMTQRNRSGEEGDSSKTILITGVSQGIGRALALELAKRGHTIIGCARSQNKLDSLQLELSDASLRNHLLFNLDVRSNDKVREMARTVKDKIGAPDIIVNNAAIMSEKMKMWEIAAEMFHDVIDINIKGTVNILRHFIPLLIPKSQGIIVNISSLFGKMGGVQASAYCSSKWAIEGLSKSVAKELPNGMTIVALDPGIINTERSVSYLGSIASQYQSPQEWALKAAPMILNLTSVDNGASLHVDDPGELPNDDFICFGEKNSNASIE